MSLTPLPTPPSTSDPANFATRADALVLALANMVAEINGGAVPLTGGTVSTLIVTGASTLAQEAATALSGALQNSWVNFGSAYRVSSYFKDSEGIVHLQGAIKSGTTTAATLLFTLPSGYRPSAKVMLSGTTSSGAWAIEVATDGQTTIQMGALSAFSSLEGMHFRAA